MPRVFRVLLAFLVFVTATWFAGVYLVAPRLPSAAATTTDSERAVTESPGEAPGAAEPPSVDAPDAATTTSTRPPPQRQTTASHPAATGLNPDLTAAFSRARAVAAERGVSLALRSGYRSAEVQQRMYDAAVRRYGSAARAQRWVLPPEKSAHVHGNAIDVRPRSGAAWLERNGAQFGLCRRYDNEWWHFELRTTPGQPCPPREPYAG